MNQYLFDINSLEKPDLYKQFGKQYVIKKSLYNGVVIMDCISEQVPVFVVETSDINGYYFPDCYEIISSFKNIS